MIKSKEEMPLRPVEIDLTGPEGNAFALLGAAKQYAKLLSWDDERVNALISEMVTSDYENLVAAFDREFGSFVTLYR